MSPVRDRNKTELILTDIRSDSSRDLVELYYSNNGKILVQHPNHTFISRHFSTHQTLETIVQEITSLGATHIVAKKKNFRDDQPFNIVQVHGKPSLGKELRERFGTHFSTKNYTQTARNEFGGPGTIHKAESATMLAIRLARLHNMQLRELKKVIAQEYPERSKTYHTRMFNELTKAAHAEEATITVASHNTYLKKLSQTIIEKRDSLQRVFKTLESQPGIQTELTKKGDVELHLTNKSHIQTGKTIDYLALYNSTWAHLDIEIPLWDTNNPENSWVVIYYENQGKVYQKEIHTASDVGSDTFDGQQVFCYHGDIAELVLGVKRSIQRQNPLVMTAHNGNFDYTKLRETPELKLLEENFTPDQEDLKEPIRDATTRFFERINMKSRLFIDFLRFAQIQHAYLPNKKLNLVAKIILGPERFDKELTYDEIKELEIIARRYDKIKNDDVLLTTLAQMGKTLFDIKEESVGAAQKIASYAGKDVGVLADIKNSAVFKNFLMRITELSTDYNLPLEHLAYSTRTLLKINEHAFTRRTGADYEKLFLSGKNSRKEYSNNKQHFRTILNRMGGVLSTAGLYADVHLMYLRYGHALRHIITRSVPEANILFKKKARSKDDSYLLSRYGNAFAEWIIADYAKIDKLERAITKKTTKVHKQIPIFEALYEQQKKQLQYVGKTTNNNLFHGELTTNEITNNVLPELQTYFSTTTITIEDVLFLINKRQKLAKAKYKFEQQFRAQPEEVKTSLESLVSSAKQFIKTNSLAIIHQEGPYFYVQGNPEQLNKEHEHTILQSFNNVLITRDVEKKSSESESTFSVGEQKLSYNLFGYYKGFKFVDHPTHYLNVHEMKQFHQFFEAYKEGRHEKAIQTIVHQYIAVLTKKVPLEELLLYSKTSQQYTAFEDNKKIYFTTRFPEGTTYVNEQGFIAPHHEEHNLLFDKQTSRYYFLKTINGCEEQVFIMQPDDVKPDWSLYQQHQEKRIRNVLHSLIGDSIEELFDDPHHFNMKQAADKLAKTHF